MSDAVSGGRPPDRSHAPTAHSPGPRWRRGLQGSLAMLALPWRRFLCKPLNRYCTAERDQHGRIYILPGIEGRSPLTGNTVNGLLDAGLPHSLCVYDWTSKRYLSALSNLTDTDRHRRESQGLADSILEYRRRCPTQPLHLIGHSGGSAIAVRALGELPAGIQASGVCLLASALSPQWDLAPALARCRRLFNFYSPLDLFFLGAGTLIFGAVDRRRAVAAGAVGFRLPPESDPEKRRLYQDRLEQIRFRIGMAGAFWVGGHQGCTHRLFIERYVAPRLLQTEPPAATSHAPSSSPSQGSPKRQRGIGLGRLENRSPAP